MDSAAATATASLGIPTRIPKRTTCVVFRSRPSAAASVPSSVRVASSEDDSMYLIRWSSLNAGDKCDRSGGEMTFSSTGTTGHWSELLSDKMTFSSGVC